MSVTPEAPRDGEMGATITLTAEQVHRLRIAKAKVSQHTLAYQMLLVVLNAVDASLLRWEPPDCDHEPPCFRQSRGMDGWHAGLVTPCEEGASHGLANVHVIVRCDCGAAYMSTDAGIAMSMAVSHGSSPSGRSADG